MNDTDCYFPANPGDIMKIIYEYYDFVKAEVNINIISKLEARKRCSLNLHEYTSLKNKRFTSMYVHSLI